MAEMNFNFLLDRDTYKDAVDGRIKLYGRAKKKLPHAKRFAKSTGEKAVDFFEDHKTGILIAGGAVAALGIAGALVSVAKHRAARKAERLVDEYLAAMKTGTLTPGFLAKLIDEKKALPVSAAQLDLIYDFTVKLAAAQGVETTLAREAVTLKDCLSLQKTALENLSE